VEHRANKVKHPQEHWKCHKQTGIPGGKRVLKVYQQLTVRVGGENNFGMAGGIAEVIHVMSKGGKNGTERAPENHCTTRKKQKVAPFRK
jgi:hypothetical protein